MNPSVVAAGWIALAAGFGCGAAHAQEIAPFRLLEWGGSATLGFWRDAQSTPGADGTDARTAQSDLRMSVLLNSRSYIYHPNLLTLDVSGGPVFERGAFDASGIRTTSRESLYDFSARAAFLQSKPYRGTVYYEHLNPSLQVAPGEAIVTESTKYGADFSLLQPLSPVPVELEAWRSTNRGQGLTRLVDDRTDQLNLRASRAFGDTGLSQLGYSRSQQRSRSGSPSLPLQASDLRTDSLTWDNQLRFGSERQWQLFSPFSFFRQRFSLGGGESVSSDSLRAGLDLRGEHREGTLQTFARADLGDTRQSRDKSTLQSFAGGATWTPDKAWSANAGLRLERERATFLDADRQEANGGVRWRRPTAFGIVSAGYSSLFGHRDQRAGTEPATVEGESLVLASTSPVPLARSRVVPGSVAVSNAPRTQIYVEGLDYQLETIGIQTRVRRLAAGNIANGETVLADYRYDVGGTVAYSQFDNAVDLAWNLDSRISARVRYLDSAQRLRSGTPTTPLNSVQDLLVSVQTDWPFRAGVEMALGGLAEWEDRRETILPYRRTLLQGHWQTFVPGMEWAQLRAGWQRSRVDYDSPESVDVDLTGWDASLWAHSPWGVEFQLAYNANRDDGGFPRRERIATARATWRVRQLSLALWGSYNEEIQADTRRTRHRIDFLMRRDF